jgi:hypothetical protein
MRLFRSIQSEMRDKSSLRKSMILLSLVVALACIAFLGGGEPALSSGTGAATPQPTIPLCCWPWLCLRVGFPDYAPHGSPDFDMRQDAWRWPPDGEDFQWTHSGPAAAADQLWYFDSEATFVLGHPYALVTSYGAWGDHDPQNVPPLITDLAGELQTGRLGTSLEDMVAGLESYIAKKGVAHDFTVFYEKGPTERWMLEESANHEVVILLLGFWQQDGGEWVRVGGHWVAVCCLDLIDRYLDLADPFLDRAAFGHPGWAYGPLPIDPTIHNDAINISHDRYYFAVTSVPGAYWGPAEYAGDELAKVLTNSLGQNFAADLEQYRGDYADTSPVHVAADYAVVFRPLSPCYERPTPTPTRLTLYLPIILKAAVLP